MTFACTPWPTEKYSLSFLVLSMSYCTYVTLAPCSIVHHYMALLCIQVLYMCAIVVQIHILLFCCFCISGVVMNFLHVWCLLLCLDFVLWRNLWHLLYYHHVQYLEQPSPMQIVVYCVLNLVGLFSNATQSSLNFCAF